jgi:DNA polymerase
MPLLFWDIETRSVILLEEAGAWRYAGDATTEILCIGYARDNDNPAIWTPGEPIPTEFTEASNNPDWRIVAHNAQFERAIATRILEPRFGWPNIPLCQQICTMTLALVSALPGALEFAVKALSLPYQKDREGYLLMKQMSRPRRARKGEHRNAIHWIDSSKLRERLHRYCIHDVESERAVYHRLPQLSAAEHELWLLDAIINERGFHVDCDLARAARDIARVEQAAINGEIADLTDGEIASVNQAERIKDYIRRHGHTLTTLTKRSISAVLAHNPCDQIRRLLELRRDGARASTRKLDRLLKSVDYDSRLRGSLRFHGSATGRWSGRGYQPQNLKKPETKDLDAAVSAVLSGDIACVRALGAPLTIAGDVSRSIICAAPSHTLIGGDFSAIESRVLAWLAGEDWKLENYRAFDRTGDPALEPYCATASRICKRKVTAENEAERSLGKVCELAFQYGGGLGAYRKFDSSDAYTDAQVEDFKREWRHAHPATMRFWRMLERAVHRTVSTCRPDALDGKFAFSFDDDRMMLTLPSGRSLVYPQARLVAGKFEGTRELRFKDNARGGWTDCAAWYGMLTENVVQAIARDLLAAAMQRLERAGYPVVLHVHDEIVCEIREGFGDQDQFLQLMTELPEWARGLPIAAKIWTGKRYAKTQPATVASTKTDEAVRNPGQDEVDPSATGIKLLENRQVPNKQAPHPEREDQPSDDEEEVEGERDEKEDTEISPLADLISEPLIDGKIRCPFHTDKTPSLQIYHDHYHCFGCGAHGNHVDWLIQVEGMTRKEATDFLRNWDGPKVARPSEADDEEKIQAAMRLWGQGHPIANTLAARYLADTRGIVLAALPADIDAVLRFHPSCPFGPGSRHPCLIALLRDAATDAPTGIHRVGLTLDARKIDRRMLGRTGVVKLWPAGPLLVLGEGIETTLAGATRVPYRSGPLQPAWSAVSTNSLSKFPVLPGVERLVILVDHDDGGKTAAACCTERWTRAGRTVIRLTPKQPGFDFNDIILSPGSRNELGV